ncbi:MAG: hypothetical protein U0105_16355 [Candidatus Obscuribacterales bacterium]
MKKAEEKYFELCTPHLLETVNVGAFEMVRRLNRDSAASAIPVDPLLVEAFAVVGQRQRMDVEAAPARTGTVCFFQSIRFSSSWTRTSDCIALTDQQLNMRMGISNTSCTEHRFRSM